MKSSRMQMCYSIVYIIHLRMWRNMKKTDLGCSKKS